MTAKILQLGFFWPTLFKDAHYFVSRFDRCQRVGNISQRHELPLNSILEVELFDVRVLILWVLLSLHTTISISWWQSNSFLNGLKR